MGIRSEKHNIKKEKKTKEYDSVQESVKLPWKDRVCENARNCLKDIHGHDILVLFLCSLAVNFVVETLALMKYDGLLGAIMKLLPDFGRVSGGNEAFAGFMGIFTHPLKVFHDPLIFLFNTCIIMVLLSFSLLFKKRYFAMTVLSAVWIGFGVANFVILSYRVTPFSAVELKLIDAAVGVMKSYVTSGVLILVIALIVVAAAVLIFVWLRAPKVQKVNRFSSLVIIIGAFFVAIVAGGAGIKSGVVASKLPNLSVNYQEYGFVYCFVSSFKTGIGKPNDYSEEKIKQIQDDTQKKLEDVTPQAAEPEEEPVIYVTGTGVTPIEDEKKPNIIFLQLESFFDITAMKNLELSQDPIPVFRSCMENYGSGYFNVPSVGAGTANTEFETITGMDLDFFGPGEYPYKTVLVDKSCETICYNLKNHGYTTHAIHNNRATFYSRNSVFRRFGFDYFTTIELMNIKEYTENGWAKDKVLTGEIIKSMKATEGRDYIYTISVQGHGEYPETPMTHEPVIKVEGGISDVGEKNRVEYYVNQIHEMDEFLGELITALNEMGEDCILVAYGDHLPNLDISEEKLENENMFQTQYFIWNNMGLRLAREDVEAYQLSAKVLNAIGVTDGAVNAYHQANWGIRGSSEYLEDLENLGYDMLYGDNNVNDGRNVYEPTKLKYGVENVELSDVYRDQSDTDYLIIKGKHFTDYSAVFIDGEKMQSQLIDENTLRVHLEKQLQDVKVVVKQSYKGKLVLQTSNEITYSYLEDEDVYNDGDLEEDENQEEDDIAGLIEEQNAIMGDEQIENEDEEEP